MTEIRIIREAPKVFLAGHTHMVAGEVAHYLAHRGLTWNSEQNGTSNPIGIIELAGRICYESFHNPKGDTAEEYTERTAIQKNHWSITEHVTLNFLIAGLPRTTLLELERHRAGTAFSFRSTRYVDTWLEFAIPPLMREDGLAIDIFEEEVHRAVGEYEWFLKFYKDEPKKRRTEAARSILPNSLTADGMFSCNINALKHIMKLRRHKDADASMIEFADEVYAAALGIGDESLSYFIGKAVDG